MRKTVLFVFFSGLLAFATLADVIGEQIMFVDPNGEDAVLYTTTRSPSRGYNLHFEKEDYADPGEHLKDFYYLNPPDITWNRQDKNFDILTFPSGSYATLTRQDLKEKISRDAAGIYTFQSSEDKPDAYGRKGRWNTPGDFDSYAYVWVLPSNMEFVDYKANNKGRWVQRHNTLAWYGEKVNNIIWTIRFKARGQEEADRLQETLGTDAQVNQDQEGIRVRLKSQVLFPSGSAKLSEKGKALISKLQSQLGGELPLIVEGHTDNVKILGDLQKTFPTNWELSAARSLAVVHYLASLGHPQGKLEARAFGEHRPVADNSTAAGRAKNRRIEVLIPR